VSGGQLPATHPQIEKSLRTKIIMLTMLEDDASVFAAMRAGACGYLLKGASPDEMISVIQAVAQGQTLFGPTIAMRLINFFQELGQIRMEAPVESPFPDLTERELEVLHLIAQGFNNQEIAQMFVISPRIVKNHITSKFFQIAGG
jgi:DNA-binding NarL/FixJ family response regulator